MSVAISPHGFITGIITMVDTITAGMVSRGYQSLVTQNSSAILSVLTLYFMSLVYRVKTETMTLQTAKLSFIRMLFIYLLATNWGVFYILIYNLFTNEPGYITKILISSAGHVGPNLSTYGALDQVFDEGMKTGARLLGMISFSSGALVYLIAGLGTIIITMVITMLALAIILFAKIVLALILFLAPIFFLFALFNSTRGWFDGWLRKCMNYALVPVLVCGVLVVLLSVSNFLLNPLMNSVKSGHPSIVPVACYVSFGVVSGWMLKQVYGMSAALSGGFALAHIAGAVGTAKGVLGQAKGMYQGSQKGVGAVKSAYRQGVERQQNEAASKAAEREAQAKAERRNRSMWNM